jgi:hypothetical protein
LAFYQLTCLSAGRATSAFTTAKYHKIYARSMSTFTTSLEPTLSKIPDFRKPAASRRKAAACLAEKLSLQF